MDVNIKDNVLAAFATQKNILQMLKSPWVKMTSFGIFRPKVLKFIGDFYSAYKHDVILA